MVGLGLNAKFAVTWIINPHSKPNVGFDPSKKMIFKFLVVLF